MNRSELQQLARARLADAKALMKEKRWAGAYYLLGYAVECALKACIARKTLAEDFPDKKLADKAWSHDIERLLSAAELTGERDTDIVTNADFSANWLIIKDWSESSRYDVKRTKAEVEALLSAITDKKNGVLKWIQARW